MYHTENHSLSLHEKISVYIDIYQLLGYANFNSFAEHYNHTESKSTNNKASSSSSSQNPRSTPNVPEREQIPQERMKQEPIDTPPISYPQPIREPPPTQPIDTKPWCYSGIDLINNGAAFWQSYSGRSL